MNYPFLIILGFLPSIIWLLFYLRHDHHPEPNRIVVKVFVFGMVMAPLALTVQLIILALFNHPESFRDLVAKPQTLTTFLLNIAVFAPIIEEFLKYKIVQTKALADPEFDEPIDAMLYCIIAALGFAAVENLIISLQLDIKQAVLQMSARFLSATLLHALASGIVGFWLAISILLQKKKFWLISTGLTLAILCHSLYNYLIWRWDTTKQAWPFLFLVATLLVLMAILIIYQFKKLKKLASICKL